MKLIHAADIHLDSPMRGLARYDGAPVERLRLATRVALGNLVDLAIDEEVDAMLIAGDLFDGDWRDYGTGARFGREMGRLREAGIPVVTIAGNHDAASRLTKGLRMPDNVRALSTRHPETVLFEEMGLAVHGQGFPQAAVHDDLSSGYPPPLAGYVNVGLLHTSADGRPGHDPYAPCLPQQLADHGYHYWALGHVHQREVLVADPPVVFSGCLQGRHVREGRPKGATLVRLADDGSITLEERVLDHVRWVVCEVDATGAEDEDEVYARTAAALEALAGQVGDRLLAVRVRLTGATAAHRALARSEERLRHEMVMCATEAVRGDAWLERVVLETGLPSASAGGDDAYTEIVRAIRGAGSSDGLLGRLADELQPLVRRLPAELRAELDLTEPATIRALLAEIERTLPMRLLEGAA